MTEFNWSDQMGSRRRHAWLLFVKGEAIMSFGGKDIPGVVVIRGSGYTKQGVWSHNSYRLELNPNVRAIAGKDGWETSRFVEGLGAATNHRGPVDTWADVANALGVSVPSAMDFLRKWRPNAAAALDEVDAKLTALDEAADKAAAEADTETVVVSFGSPTRRQREAGFWTNPKSISGHDGELQLIDEERGWDKGNIKVVGIVGTVISATHARGHGGGYVSVTVAVIPGTSTKS